MKTKLLEKLAKEKGYKDVISMLMDYGVYPLSRLQPTHTKVELAKEITKLLISQHISKRKNHKR